MELTNQEVIRQLKAYSENRLSESEQKELEAWIRENEHDRIGLTEFSEYISTLKELSLWGNIDSEKAWLTIHTSLHKTRRLTARKWYRIAASLLIIVSLGLTVLLLQDRNDEIVAESQGFENIIPPGEVNATLELANGSTVILSEEELGVLRDERGAIIERDSLHQLNYQQNRGKQLAGVFNRLHVPRGGVYSLILADGTKVWMNSDSELRYPASFFGDRREVYLKGEAFFEVAHHDELPFVVNTSASLIEVIGTKFNVSAYENQDYVATTLLEGKVQVQSPAHESVELTPGQQSLVSKSEHTIRVDEVNPELYISWVNGIFEFDNMSLEYIVAQMERWYDVEFRFQNPALKELHFTGAAERDRSIDFLISAISKTSGVRFDLEEAKIVISK